MFRGRRGGRTARRWRRTPPRRGGRPRSVTDGAFDRCGGDLVIPVAEHERRQLVEDVRRGIQRPIRDGSVTDRFETSRRPLVSLCGRHEAGVERASVDEGRLGASAGASGQLRLHRSALAVEHVVDDLVDRLLGGEQRLPRTRRVFGVEPGRDLLGIDSPPDDAVCRFPTGKRSWSSRARRFLRAVPPEQSSASATSPDVTTGPATSSNTSRTSSIVTESVSRPVSSRSRDTRERGRSRRLNLVSFTTRRTSRTNSSAFSGDGDDPRFAAGSDGSGHGTGT